MSFVCPFKVLGVPKGSSVDVAKKAFRKVAKECHPDINPDDAEKEKRYKEASEAYDRIKKGDTEPEAPSNTFAAGTPDWANINSKANAFKAAARAKPKADSSSKPGSPSGTPQGGSFEDFLNPNGGIDMSKMGNMFKKK